MMKYALFRKMHFAVLTVALLFAYLSAFASQSAKSMQSSREIALAASTHAVELSDKPVRVELASGGSNENTGLCQMLESLPASRKVYLILTGLHAAKQPGTLFHLYLDLPEGVTPKGSNAWHIGSINFYEAVPGLDAARNKPDSSMSFDITGVTRNLCSSQKLTAASTITIMATHAPEDGSEPMIEHIEVIVK